MRWGQSTVWQLIRALFCPVMGAMMSPLRIWGGMTSGTGNGSKGASCWAIPTGMGSRWARRLCCRQQGVSRMISLTILSVAAGHWPKAGMAISLLLMRLSDWGRQMTPRPGGKGARAAVFASLRRVLLHSPASRKPWPLQPASRRAYPRGFISRQAISGAGAKKGWSPRTDLPKRLQHAKTTGLPIKLETNAGAQCQERCAV